MLDINVAWYFEVEMFLSDNEQPAVVMLLYNCLYFPLSEI